MSHFANVSKYTAKTKRLSMNGSQLYCSDNVISIRKNMHVWTHAHKGRKWARLPSLLFPLCTYTLWLIALQPYSYQEDTTNFSFACWQSALVHPLWLGKPRGHGWRMLLVKSLREKGPLEIQTWGRGCVGSSTVYRKQGDARAKRRQIVL